MSNSVLLADIDTLVATAVEAAAALRHAAAAAARTDMVAGDGRIDSAALEAQQHRAHGLAWLSTYAEALREMQGWHRRLADAGRGGELEALILQISLGDYLAQMAGGIAMSQGEIIRLHELGLDEAVINAFTAHPAVRTLVHQGNSTAARARAAELIAGQASAATIGDDGLDEMFTMIRDQFRRFTDEQVAPQAHEWHLKDELIPLDIIGQMSELGVFGLTVPEAYGGLGMGKTAMCVVSEELSRGYIGVGSLGTRSEIAAELILGGGTEEQKQYWLPGIAAGEILPTAVFTEPGTGSDLAALRSRAVRQGDHYSVTGNKTWITHAARADLMTLLVRTNPDEKGYRGLSMLLAEKPRGTKDGPFPARGMSGGEIGVLGYRGMKEYEIGFDGFAVPAANLLGGTEGQGFKQLMRTFESARIQTAARAIGVAQNALDLALRYAHERVQFGKPLYAFPRVANKIVTMVCEIMTTRQLTYFAARQKDEGHRCDLEAGMAKLLAARVAWAAADNAVQVHGGNGFALEYPVSRVLCDARILNIFEGAAEIQAQVIARRLLET